MLEQFDFKSVFMVATMCFNIETLCYDIETGYCNIYLVCYDMDILMIICGNQTDVYCNYKYILHRETVESSQQKRKPQNSMEAMLPQSFGTSDSEILGVIVCQW